MASHYDPHESRPRRDDTTARSAIDSFLRPEAAVDAHNGKVRRGDDRIETAHSDHRTRERSRPRNPRSRSSHPPLLQPDSGVPHRSRSRSRRRIIRPPPPLCEDEAVSLAKEAGWRVRLEDIVRDEAVSRGTLDQEPILDDVVQKPAAKQQDTSPAQRHPKRPSRDSHIPTPPTSDDEVSKEASSRHSKLRLNLNTKEDDVPELGKRTSTPYAYSKEQGLAKDDKARAQLLSPDSFLSPPTADPSGRPGKRPLSKSQPSSPTNMSSARTHTQKSSSDYFALHSNDSAIDEADYDASDSASRSRRNKNSTYPSARPEPSSNGAQLNTKDYAHQSGLAPPRRRNLDARRNTDTGSTLPKLNVDKNRRPTPLMTSTAISGSNYGAIYASPTMHKSALDIPLPVSRNPSQPSSRNVSPANSSAGQHRHPTPPDTPLTSVDVMRNSSMSNSPASRPGSASESRPASPSPRTPVDASRFPKTDLDWSAVMAANAARRSQPPSRVAAIRQETMPHSPREHHSHIPVAAPASRNSSLPYPVDDGPSTPTVWMPAEQHHQYFPEARPILQAPLMQEPKTFHHSAPPASAVGSSSSAYSRPSRPSVPPRHSTTDIPTLDKPPPPEKPRALEHKRISSFNNPSQAKKDLPALLKKGLPDCSRPKPVAGYGDWYCLTTSPSLDFCPDCIDHIERTAFRLSFRKSPPRSSSKKVVCALGGTPWIQLAWLLTLHQGRTNLALLEDIARVEETTEPCPGDLHTVRAWYGLKDRDGYFVPNFGICYNDVKKIETLMPSLNNIFVPLPRRMSQEKTMCAMRTEGNRFDVYFDALLKAHEEAVLHRRPGDAANFIDLVKKRQRLRECRRDNLYLNQLWHFIPTVQDLTVCEDCFETVIEPEIRKNKDLAMRFNRTVQPVYGEGPGVSCQLYSPRMRKVFARAVGENDVRYLARKARERRETELRLQEKFQAAFAKLKRLDREGYEGEEEQRRLEDIIWRVKDEWKSWE